MLFTIARPFLVCLEALTVPKSITHKSSARTLAILEAFESKRRPLTLRELAEHCEIPVSTCHALVHTLLDLSYLHQVNRRKELYPTRRILDLAATIITHDPFLSRVAPILEQLRTETQETVILGKRQKDQILYLEVLESPQTIRYSSRAGELKPLHSTSIGKVMLGALKPAELRAWLSKQSLPKVTASTITSRKRLIENLNKGTQLGYFTTKGENVLDTMAVAVPVWVSNELLGLTVAGPIHRMDENFDKQLSRLLKAQHKLQQKEILT